MNDYIHMVYQYRTDFWYFRLPKEEVPKLKGYFGEVDPNNSDGLDQIGRSYKDYHKEDHQHIVYNGLINHFYHRGYFDKDDDMMYLGLTLGRDGILKEPHELQGNGRFSYLSHSQPLEELPFSILFEYIYDLTHSGSDEFDRKGMNYFRNIITLGIGFKNLINLKHRLENGLGTGRDLHLMEELFHQTSFLLFSSNMKEEREEFIPKDYCEVIEEQIEKFMKDSHEIGLKDGGQRMIESNSVMLPFKERIKKRESLQTLLKDMFKVEYELGVSCN